MDFAVCVCHTLFYIFIYNTCMFTMDLSALAHLHKLDSFTKEKQIKKKK